MKENIPTETFIRENGIEETMPIRATKNSFVKNVHLWPSTRASWMLTTLTETAKTTIFQIYKLYAQIVIGLKPTKMANL